MTSKQERIKYLKAALKYEIEASQKRARTRERIERKLEALYQQHHVVRRFVALQNAKEYRRNGWVTDDRMIAHYATQLALAEQENT